MDYFLIPFLHGMDKGYSKEFRLIILSFRFLAFSLLS